MSYEVKVAVCPEIRTNNIEQCERHAELQNFRMLNRVVRKEPLRFKMLIQNANGTLNISKQSHLQTTMAYTINCRPRLYETLKLSHETFFNMVRNVKI